MFIMNWINKWRLTEQVNDIRIRNGLNSLLRVRSLDNVAWQHAMYMAKDDRLGHGGFDARDALLRWQNKKSGRSYISANCGECPGRSLDMNVIGATINSWMNSDSHRNAILNPLYSRTGIACVTKQEQVYIVQVFAGDAVETSQSPIVQMLAGDAVETSRSPIVQVFASDAVETSRSPIMQMLAGDAVETSQPLAASTVPAAFCTR